MGGGIIQLVAIGAQDKKLIGNPKTNFFKSVYTHYYNFSMESIQQYFKGGTDFNKRCSVNIKRVGDLVTKCYLECTIDNLCYGFPTSIDCITGYQTTNTKITDCIARFTSNLATAIIDKVELEIGGQIIDTHTGTWMETWNELSDGSNGLTFPYFGNLECDDELDNIDLCELNHKAKSKCINIGGIDHQDCPKKCAPPSLTSSAPPTTAEIAQYVNCFIDLTEGDVCNSLDYLFYKIIKGDDIKYPIVIPDACQSTPELCCNTAHSQCLKEWFESDTGNSHYLLYLVLSIIKIIKGYSCLNACSTEEEQLINTQKTILLLYSYCDLLYPKKDHDICKKLVPFLTANIYLLKQILSGLIKLESYINQIILLDFSGQTEKAVLLLEIINCMLDVNDCNAGCSCCLGENRNDSLECNHCNPSPNPNDFKLDRGDIFIEENNTYLTAGVGGGFVQGLDSYQLCRMKTKRYWSLKTPFYVPFNFWFNRDIGSALPIIALQYHEVVFNVTFQDYKYIGNNEYVYAKETQPKLNASLWVDYIFLDTDLRRKFSQEKHEYIIDQVQFNEFSGGNNNLELNFNHPVKFLTWIGSPYKIPILEQGYEFASIGPSTPTSFIKQYCESHFDYTDVKTYMKKMKNICNVKIELKLNGHNRFEQRNARYFTNKTVKDSGDITGSPYILLNRDSGLFKGGSSVTGNTLVNPTNDAYALGYYPFCLPGYALGLTPAGTCNFSRLNSVELVFRNPVENDFLLGPTIVYAVNYNFLRIESGMAGLQFSN